MTVNIITAEDLQNFKKELFVELADLINARRPPPSKWLKSSQVRELLQISPGTLQNLRVNGRLGYTKVSGTMFYEYKDIMEMMEREKMNARR